MYVEYMINYMVVFIPLNPTHWKKYNNYSIWNSKTPLYTRTYRDKHTQNNTLCGSDRKVGKKGRNVKDIGQRRKYIYKCIAITMMTTTKQKRFVLS